MLAIQGFAAETSGKMIAATGIGPLRIGRVGVLPQHPVDSVGMADAMIAAKPSLELMIPASSMARQSDGWALRIASRSGSTEIFARTLVDASGDAMVAAWLGEGFTMAPSTRLQRPDHVFCPQSIGHGRCDASEDLGLAVRRRALRGHSPRNYRAFVPGVRPAWGKSSEQSISPMASR